MDAPDLRLALAEQLLQEAVYRSRARQSAAHAIAPAPAAGSSAASAPGCGLGRSAEVELDLSERGRELCRELWPWTLSAGATQRLRDAVAGWIGEQDALDRRRNHFLRDFRTRHGFDRTRYSAEQALELEAGLEQVNEEETRRRRAVALALSRLS